MLNVMAVNMLIAMMNSTYAQVQKRGEQVLLVREGGLQSLGERGAVRLEVRGLERLGRRSRERGA